MNKKIKYFFSLTLFFTLLINFSAKAIQREEVFFKASEFIRTSEALYATTCEVPSPEVNIYFPATNFSTLKNKPVSFDEKVDSHINCASQFFNYSFHLAKINLHCPVY